MQTRIHPSLAGKPGIAEAEAILRRCVHCGFCTATCPTYQLLGDELDGPRGRIYLIKNLLESNEISDSAVTHLDRCLTCRACETTCPSGVEYGQLLDTGRELAATRARRPFLAQLVSRLVRGVVLRRWLFRPLVQIGMLMRPLLPWRLKQHLPVRINRPRAVQAIPGSSPRVLLLSGCVQSAVTPGVVSALKHLLLLQGMASEVVSEACCGALELHLSEHEKARQRMRALLDLIWPRINQIDAIVSSATGCAVTLEDYPTVLGDDPVYRERAAVFVAKLKDPVELLSDLGFQGDGTRVAVHTPCSMQHGMKMSGELETLIARLGFEVVQQAERHLCCGSAGAYSLLQPVIADQLRSRKLAHLQAAGPEVILTANIGCQLHMGAAADVPVMHWLEFIYSKLSID